MKTLDTNPLSPNYDKRVRGFKVAIDLNGRRGIISPGKGCSLFTGQDALAIMESYNNRALTVTALTESDGIEERLTIEEMRSIYIDNKPNS